MFKLIIKTPQKRLLLLLLTLNIFLLHSAVIIAEFEQINAGWVWGNIASDNTFDNCQLPYELRKSVGLQKIRLQNNDLPALVSKFAFVT